MAPIIFWLTVIEITVQTIKIEGEFESVLNSLKKREWERERESEGEWERVRDRETERVRERQREWERDRKSERETE